MTELVGQEINGYKFLEKIGEGGFSQVYKVYHEKYQQIFCAKVMKYDQDEKNWTLFRSEMDSLVSLDHINIIRLYNFFKVDDRLYLILEYCPGGSLYDRVEKNGPLTGDELMNVTEQLVSGVQYIHQQRIAHRDIKPQNVLFDSHGRVRIADFGISKLGDGDKLCTFTCSAAYAAPEILGRKPYSPFAADIWALGVTLYYISHGKLPWPTSSFVLMTEAIEQGLVDIDWRVIEPEYAMLIKEMLKVNPSARTIPSEFVEKHRPHYKLMKSNATLSYNHPKRLEVRKIHPSMKMASFCLASTPKFGGFNPDKFRTIQKGPGSFSMPRDTIKNLRPVTFIPLEQMTAKKLLSYH